MPTIRSKPRPDANEPVTVFPDGRQVCNMNTTVGRWEYGHRLEEMVTRQKGKCAICTRIMGLPTFDHQSARGMGGGFRDDRIEIEGFWHNAALCMDCNIKKGSRRYHWTEGDYRPV